MPTRLFALLTPVDADAALGAGVVTADGAPLRIIAFDAGSPVVAVGGDAGGGEETMPPARLAVAHELTVSALLAVAAEGVIPALAGPVHADDASCRDALRSRAGEIAELWERARGRVEMTVVVAVPRAAEPPRAASGRAYLTAARDSAAASRHAIDDAIRTIDGAVSTMAVARAVRTLPGHTGAAISHLVARPDVGAYASAVESLRDGLLVRLAIDGPRAPYSFAALAAHRTPARGRQEVTDELSNG